MIKAGGGIIGNVSLANPIMGRPKWAAHDSTSLAAAEEAMRQTGVRNLFKRCGEPSELAYSMLFLACDGSSSVTGANFMIDGVSA
jgi:NAD(P)-dependent dehydrogenase (short-subunit alcohol dehydrogenase family)